MGGRGGGRNKGGGGEKVLKLVQGCWQAGCQCGVLTPTQQPQAGRTSTVPAGLIAVPTRHPLPGTEKQTSKKNGNSATAGPPEQRYSQAIRAAGTSTGQAHSLTGCHRVLDLQHTGPAVPHNSHVRTHTHTQTQGLSLSRTHMVAHTHASADTGTGTCGHTHKVPRQTLWL